MKRTQLICALAGFGLAGLSTLTYGATPLADTPIGNKAKATFSDESGVQREVFSNTVITLVEQVYALEIQQDSQRLATPGSQIYFPHTIINHGNGLDAFTLDPTYVSGVQLLNVAIYPDANQDGLPDTHIAITETPQIAVGGNYSFVVVGIVPPSATPGPVESELRITATSKGDTAVSDSNLDKFTITNSAVMEVTKAVDINAGLPGATTEITYTLTYSNKGNSSAEDFTLRDRIPVGMSYVAGSARWHKSSSTALTDANDGDPSNIGIRYDFGHTETGVATFVIDEVIRGESGYVTFKVTVDAGVPPSQLINVAEYNFTTDNSPKGPYPTNQVPFTVQQVAGVTLDAPTVVHPAIAAGEKASWVNVLTNTGTGTDTFDIIIDPGHNFPAGTSFVLYYEDGKTPMLDSNGNGIPDTGPLAPGAQYNVILEATLPSNVTGAITEYVVTKTARSTVDPVDAFDSAEDKLAGVNAASADLTDTAKIGDAGVLGQGVITTPDAGNPVIRTIAANPGTTTRFNLFANNSGTRPDSYNLLADMQIADGFSHTHDMLPGWSAVFRSGTAAVSNTGTVLAGQAAEISLDVAIPANALPGDYPVFVQLRSPVTGAIDHIQYIVRVNTVRRITLESDNIGQTFPGGSIEYVHILTNHGNVVEGLSDGSGAGSVIEFTLQNSLASSGFNAIVYYDANGDGTLDSSDPVLTGQTLADLKPDGLKIGSGESVRVFVKVFAPLGIVESATNLTTVTVSVTGQIAGVDAPASVSNIDTTTIVRGDLVVEKRQAVDLNRDGDITGAELPFRQTQMSAPPGAYIIYEITVINSGSADATGISVYDAIPANTTYLGIGNKGVATITGDGTSSDILPDPIPADWAGGLEFRIGALKPQERAVIYFGVKINE